MIGVRSGVIMLALLLSVHAAHAGLSAAAFESANKLFEQGKFAEAASAYETLLQSGQASAALYFNWGNACFKAGHLGRAIYAYRQAEGLTPRDPDVRANLQFARGQVQGPTLPPARYEQWLGKLSLNEWTVLAASAVWVWFLLLVLRQWKPPLKLSLRGYVTTAGALAGLLCVICGAALYLRHYAPVAIVVAHDAVIRQAPLDESQSVFTLNDGAEVRVLDQKDQWFQVTTDPRRIGWLRRDQVLLRAQPIKR